MFFRKSITHVVLTFICALYTVWRPRTSDFLIAFDGNVARGKQPPRAVTAMFVAVNKAAADVTCPAHKLCRLTQHMHPIFVQWRVNSGN